MRCLHSQSGQRGVQTNTATQSVRRDAHAQTSAKSDLQQIWPTTKIMSTSPCKHCKSVITKPHEKTERQISLEFIGLPFQNRCTDHCYLVRACKVALWNTFSHPPRQRALCETSALTDNLSGHMWHTARMKLVQMLAPLAFSIHDAS